MYATFPLTCRAASSSSFSAHCRRRPLLLLIVPIVVLSMATDFANGMGCASSKDQASSSSSSNRKKNSAGAGTSGARGGSGASNLPDVPYLDQRHWQRCLGHCNQYNSVDNVGAKDRLQTTANAFHLHFRIISSRVRLTVDIIYEMT
ncbi:hypothetical protein niasHS_002057 [Heterodera schachtii]|uniref:Uncharacterized protein n=1 Tax=Heterodera schachtii TaxID=97005 RepID=A0ABD2K5P8_HETSC